MFRKVPNLSNFLQKKLGKVFEIDYLCPKKNCIVLSTKVDGNAYKM